MNDVAFVSFDNSLPLFTKFVIDGLGPESLETGLFLRDVSGRLTFVVPDDLWSPRHEQVGEIVANQMSRYVDGPLHALSTPQRLFDNTLSIKEGAVLTAVVIPDAQLVKKVWLIDRRAVGQDWLQQPLRRISQVPVIVFASIKGGVGRSTALCVAASYLASKGKRVLAIDMDLEAPGLGTMLLSKDTLPANGLLDYIVERGLGEVPERFLIDTVGPSWLAAGRGRIDVVPAVGSVSGNHPDNILPKIARAYIASAEGALGGLSELVFEYISRITDNSKYDVVLLDARAGLHETTASAILGLGAEVYLFGVDQPQTLSGFDYLLSHIAVRTPRTNEFWSRLHFVQSKALSEDAGAEFFSGIESILKARLFPSKEITPNLEEMASGFEVEWADELASAEASNGSDFSDFMDGFSFLSIPEVESYRSFNPLMNPDLLQISKYSLPYAAFINDVESVLADYQFNGVLNVS